MASIELRNNNGIDFSDTEIRKEFPAVFNTRRSASVSEDYQFYNSEKIIEIMEASGLRLVALSQERLGWSQKRQPHTQIHTMRFMAPEIALRDFGVGDSRPEVVVMNSHDGRCTLKAMAGVFRLICSNGMIAGDASLGSVIRRHYGEANAFGKVQEILSDLPETVSAISRRIADWSALELSPAQQITLAKQLMEIRKTPSWLLPEQVLEHRREGEKADSDGRRDLWTTFNVLQESLTNASVKRLEGEGRARSIQPISAAFSNIKTNQQLWTKAEDYFTDRVSKLKGDAKEQFEALAAKREKQAKPVIRKLEAVDA